jgi:hypothetical protein
MNMSEATLDSQQIVDSAWQDQAIWSETANRLKIQLTTWRKSAAIAGIIGAFLETLVASMTGLGLSWLWIRTILALLGAIILAAVPYILKTKVSNDQVIKWVRARSVSEGLKETIYRYLLRVPPFGPASTPADLIKDCQILKNNVEDLGEDAATVSPRRKERPLTLTIDEYIENRVNDQIEHYYRPKAQENALAAKKLHGLEFFLGLLAVILGAIAGAATATGLPELSTLSPWVAVVTTAGAAVTAHLAASRYDHQAMIYFSTANRIKGVRDAWLATSDRLESGRIAKFVDDIEHAISTENEAWLAGWTGKKTGE